MFCMTSDALRQLVDRGVLAHYIAAQQVRDRMAGSRWSIDLDAQQLRLEQGEQHREYRVHLLGLRRREPGEWMWAWHNVNALPTAAIALAERVKAQAERHGFPEGLLAEQHLTAELTAERLVIAAKALIGTRMSVELPVSAELAATMFLGDESEISDPTVAQIHKAVLRAAQSGIMVDHRSGVRALEGFRGLGVAEHGSALLVEAVGGALAVEFDELGRVARLRRLVKKTPAPAVPNAANSLMGEGAQSANARWTLAHAWTMPAPGSLTAERSTRGAEAEVAPTPPKALLDGGAAASHAASPAEGPASSAADATPAPSAEGESARGVEDALPSRRELRELAQADAQEAPQSAPDTASDDDLDTAWNADAMGAQEPDSAPPQPLLMGTASTHAPAHTQSPTPAAETVPAAPVAPQQEAPATTDSAPSAQSAAPAHEGWSLTGDNPNETSVVPRLSWGRSPFGDAPAEDSAAAPARPLDEPASELSASEEGSRPSDMDSRSEPVAQTLAAPAAEPAHDSASSSGNTDSPAENTNDEYSSGMTFFPPIDAGLFGGATSSSAAAQAELATGPNPVVSATGERAEAPISPATPPHSSPRGGVLEGAPEAPQFGSPAPQFGAPSTPQGPSSSEQRPGPGAPQTRQFGSGPAAVGGSEAPSFGGNQPPQQFQPPMRHGADRGHAPVGPRNTPFSPRRDGGIPPVPPAPQGGRPVWGQQSFGAPQGQLPFGGAPQQRPPQGQPPYGQPPQGQPPYGQAPQVWPPQGSNGQGPQGPNGQPPQVWPPQGPNGQPSQQGPWNQR